MDPNQIPGQGPAAPQAPLPPSQYDFITNPAKPPRKSLFSSGGDKTRLLIIVIGGLVFFIMLLLVGTMIFGGDTDRDALLKVARQQSQVIAVADMAKDDLGTTDAQNFALTTKLSVTSEQQALLAQLKKSKPKPKEYSVGVSTKTKTQLETAQRNGRFDEAFVTALKESLTNYQKELKAANAAVNSKSTKVLLGKDFESATILLSIPTN